MDTTERELQNLTTELFALADQLQLRKIHARRSAPILAAHAAQTELRDGLARLISRVVADYGLVLDHDYHYAPARDRPTITTNKE